MYMHTVGIFTRFKSAQMHYACYVVAGYLRGEL